MAQSKLRNISDSDKGVVGSALISSAATGEKYSSAIKAVIREMIRETHSELSRMFAAPAYALDAFAEDASPAARARVILDRLRKKYGARFGSLAKTATLRMIRSTIKHVDTSVGLSLKEMSRSFELPRFWSSRLREIVAASTEEASQLIVTIPSRFLDEVQTEAMRSIINGRGMEDLAGYLTTKYKQNVRKAHLVALDQTRKVFSSLAAQRMQDAGVRRFIWKHSHGGHDPRPQHEAWDGKVFSYDKLPVDKDFGPVLPGWAINCRCFSKPIIDFGDADG